MSLGKRANASMVSLSRKAVSAPSAIRTGQRGDTGKDSAAYMPVTASSVAIAARGKIAYARTSTRIASL